MQIPQAPPVAIAGTIDNDVGSDNQYQEHHLAFRAATCLHGLRHEQRYGEQDRYSERGTEGAKCCGRQPDASHTCPIHTHP